MKNRTVYSRNNKLNCETEVRVAIYCRLSKDDNLDSESESIQNQRKLLIDYCTEQGWKIVSCYEDDGISGLKMDTRPGLQRMLDDIRRGRIDLVITKDSSRLARNYLDFGLLFEKFFPKNHVRYIGLTDNVDSERDDGFIPIRAYFNEHYCRDLSGKRTRDSSPDASRRSVTKKTRRTRIISSSTRIPRRLSASWSHTHLTVTDRTTSAGNWRTSGYHARRGGTGRRDSGRSIPNSRSLIPKTDALSGTSRRFRTFSRIRFTSER